MVQQAAIRPSSGRVMLRRFAFGLLALLCIGVAGYALTYLTGRAFPPGVRDNYAGQTMLILHAAAASFALLAGPWQFLPRLRARRRRVHRWTGRVYMLAALIGGAAGMVVAWNVATGEVARWGFFSLSVLWLFFSAQGWAAALRADYASHRAWMVRSFSMALAAVTLRIYLGIGTGLMGLTFEEAYPAIAWISWVPNLVAAELWLRRTPRLAF